MNLTSIQTNKPVVLTNGFTDDQSKAYDSLIEWIKTPFNAKDYKRALVGPAGTGKTFLIKSIISNCNISYSKIGLSAPTHKATRVLQKSIDNLPCDVKTLQSDLGLRLNITDNFDINNPPFDPKGTVKVGNYSLYIVDESSMISSSLQTLLERFCLQSGVKLIQMGDASQLPPVNENSSPAFRNVKTHKLAKIVRQDDDNPVKKLLDLLRYDISNNTFRFLDYISKSKYETDEANTKGFYVMNATEFNNTVIEQFSREEFQKNIDLVRIVAYTNVCVTSWNNFVRNTIVKNNDKGVLTKHDLILSLTTIVDDFKSPIITNSEEYVIKDIVNWTHKTYGFKGYMVTFTAIHGGSNTVPLFVVDHSDVNSITQYYKVLNAKIEYGRKHGGSAWKDYFDFKNTILLLTNIIDSHGKILFNRDIDYGFALTAHRSQGSTFENVLVDVNDIVYDKNGVPYTNAGEINRRLYVACSRCRNKLFLKYGC